MLTKIIAAVMATAFTASAWAWQPTRPIDVTVGFTAGSANDIIIRALVTEVEKNTGSKFIINYRPGAGGVIGNSYVVKQQPDGYSVVVGSMLGVYAMDQLNGSLSYDVNSFTYLFELARSNFAVVAKIDDPVNSVQQFVDLLKSDQNVTMSSGGGSRLVQESLRDRLKYGSNIVQVNYKGPVEALLDVASGNLRFTIPPISVAIPFLQDNNPKVKVVALSGAARDPQFPSVGTLDSVLPGMIIPAEWGLLGPRGMSSDIIDWYRREFVRAFAAPTVQQIYKKNVLTVNQQYLDHKSWENYVKSQSRRYDPLVQRMLIEQNYKK